MDKDLLPIWCPDCEKITDKISLSLLKKAGKLEIVCRECYDSITRLEYLGEDEGIRVSHNNPLEEFRTRRAADAAHNKWFNSLSKEEQDQYVLLYRP